MIRKLQKLRITNKHAERYEIKSKATYYKDFVRVWIPNQPYYKYPEGYEQSKRQLIAREIDSDEDTELYETNIERSVRRTRKTIKDYTLVNDFDLFATFTFANDRQNEARSRRRFHNWLHNQRSRNGKFRYVAVPERHKDDAIHFHALIGGYTGKLEIATNIKTGETISDGRGGLVYNFSEYKLGFNSAKIIEQDPESKTKTSFYLQKYITKDTVIQFGKNRYWASKDLKRPVVVENPEPFYVPIEANRHWVIDHGTILEFDIDNNPIIKAFIEANQND